MLYCSELLASTVVSIKATLGGCGAPGHTAVVFLANLGNSKSFVWYLFMGDINAASGKESVVKSHGRVRV